MISQRWCCAFLIGVALGLPDYARAAESDAASGAESSEPRAQALDLATEARGAFDRGDFAQAAKLLRRAHELYPAPELLYNLGRALESAGQDEEAVAAYESYLERAGHSESLTGIRRAVAILKTRIAERKRTEEDRRGALAKASAAERRSRQSPPEKGVSPLAWVVTAVGVAGLATGAVFGALAKRQESRAAEAPTHAGAMDAFQQGERYATIANVSLIAGGVIATAGGVWLVVEHADADPGKRSLSLEISGRF